MGMAAKDADDAALSEPAKGHLCGGFAVFGADLGEHRVLHHTLSALAAQQAAVVNQGKRNNVCSAKGLLENNSPHR